MRIDRSRAAPALLVLLSAIGGSMDVIGYLSLDGLFTNAITGNLVLLCVHLVDGVEAQIARLLAVPVFVATIVLTTLLACRLRVHGHDLLRPLLLLHLLLLLAFSGLCIAAGPHIVPNAASTIVAGMIGVSAMAVQNTLVQISFAGLPPTAVMTGNISRFAVDVSQWFGERDAAELARARQRAVQTLPVILGFGLGCVLGAASEAAVGLWATALPVGLAALALAAAFAVEL